MALLDNRRRDRSIATSIAGRLCIDQILGVASAGAKLRQWCAGAVVLDVGLRADWRPYRSNRSDWFTRDVAMRHPFRSQLNLV
jgi:hypothetical protein